MPKRKRNQKFAKLGEKDSWHSYGLQVLTPSKFTMVVSKILQGRYNLLSSKLDKRHQGIRPI